jgi:hypothetical protein
LADGLIAAEFVSAALRLSGLVSSEGMMEPSPGMRRAFQNGSARWEIPTRMQAEIGVKF